jgi:type II secretory pathway pseudopilin PulG
MAGRRPRRPGWTLLEVACVLAVVLALLLLLVYVALNWSEGRTNVLG